MTTNCHSTAAERRFRNVVVTAAACVAVGAVTAAVVAAPRASGASGTASPLRAVTITLALEAHARRGAMGANRVSQGKRATAGDEFEGTVGAGTLESRDACDVQITPQAPLYLTWRVRTKLRSATTDRVELDVSWTRTTAGSGAVAEGSATVAVAPGRSHLVDIISVDPKEERMCSHVALTVTVDRANSVTGELLAHRLWLVHERGGVRTVSEPIEVVGMEGEAVAFRFRPLRWNLAGSMVTTTQGAQIDVDVLGTVVSEASGDGRVETTVDVRRETTLSPYSARGSGTMVMTGQMGEAGEVELPLFAGLGVLPADRFPAGPLARGLTRNDNRVRVDFSQFFADSRTSLVITVERLR